MYPGKVGYRYMTVFGANDGFLRIDTYYLLIGNTIYALDSCKFKIISNFATDTIAKRQ